MAPIRSEIIPAATAIRAANGFRPNTVPDVRTTIAVVFAVGVTRLLVIPNAVRSWESIVFAGMDPITDPTIGTAKALRIKITIPACM